MDRNKVKHAIKNYIKGNIRFAEFAITNCCIAKCSFCDIWKQPHKVFTDKEKSIRAIDKLAELGVSQLTLTGGEPLLHPDVIELVRCASGRRIHNTVLVAAPNLLLRGDTIARLEDAGCDMVVISYDSNDPGTMARSRQIENIMQDMRDAVAAIRKTRLKTMASILIWNDNYDSLEEVCKGAGDMGFNVVSLNYPTFSESTVYTLGGEGIRMTKQALIEALKNAIELKNSRKYNIVNPTISMQNIINYLEDPDSAQYHCFGGERVLFVDWYFDVRPCMQLENVIGNITDITEGDLSLPPCNKCNMSWYRDFSTIFYGVKTVPALIKSAISMSKLV